MPAGPYNKKKPGRGPCKSFAETGTCKSVRCPFAHEKTKSTGGVLGVMLKLLFEKQFATLFEPETGMLHLNSLAACPDVEVIKSSIDFNTAAFCESLVTVIKDVIRPAPSFYVLDSNKIVHPQHFLKALTTHELHAPVRGLSFSNNSIKNLEFLPLLAPFAGLQELVFEKNPVAELPDYRPTIRKKFPELLGLDHEGINRPPLSLPWPVAPVYTPEEQQVLEWVENCVIAPAEASGPNGLVRVYHADALLSISVDSRATIEAPKPTGEVRREVVREYVALRSKHAERSRNCITKAAGSSRVAQGVTEVLSTLAGCVYPASMHVRHELDPRADVALMSDEMTPLVAVVTLHGRISWVHKSTVSDPPVTRRFVRTLVIASCMGEWVISNDQLTLLPDADDIVFVGDSPARVDRVARKWNIAHRLDFFHTLVAACNNDWDVKATLDDVRMLDGAVLDACNSAAAGDVPSAIKVARAISRFGMDPGVAAKVLDSHGWDFAALEMAVASQSAA